MKGKFEVKKMCEDGARMVRVCCEDGARQVRVRANKLLIICRGHEKRSRTKDGRHGPRESGRRKREYRIEESEQVEEEDV